MLEQLVTDPPKMSRPELDGIIEMLTGDMEPIDINVFIDDKRMTDLKITLFQKRYSH